MRAPEFWWRKTGLAAVSLMPLSWIYGAAAEYRMHRQARHRADVPVICIGNFTAGGAGKTPTALTVADLVRQTGKPPVFLTRGYGGRLAGPVVVDPTAHGAADVGDEALLLARKAPTIVARNRAAGAAMAVAQGAGAIVMDDGFQNPALAKTLSLVVVDMAVGLGNGRVIPAGPLRAPLNAQLALADGVVLIGDTLGAGAIRLAASAHDVPTLSARLRPLKGYNFAGRRVLAFAGIGRPEKFFSTMEDCGAEIVERRAFADHHTYTDREAAALIEDAARGDLQLVTTEKDHARLDRAPDGPLRQLHEKSAVLGIDCVFEDLDAVKALIAKTVA